MDIGFILVFVVLLLLYMVSVIIGYRYKKKIIEQEKKYEQLKTEVRLLQQENYYLKMMTGADRV